MNKRPSGAFLVASSSLLLLLHAGLALTVAAAHNLSLPEIMLNWDSAWYVAIARDGYGERSGAFFPLYPLLLRFLTQATGLTAHAQLVGAFFSTLVFFLFVGLQAYLLKAPQGAVLQKAGLLPGSRQAWLVFLLWPTSYVFHSNHSEALFLLLIFLAMTLAPGRHWILAAVAAGLAALTRVQGIPWAVGVAFVSALARWPSPASWPRRLQMIALSGAISGGLYLLFPLYQMWSSGNFMQVVDAQKHWHGGLDLGNYLRTFWFGNPWQNTNFGSLLRYGAYLVLMAGALVLARASLAVGLAAVGYLALTPLSGEFSDILRHGAPLFPVLFALGKSTGRWPRWLLVALGACLLYLNYTVTRGYLLARWAY